MLLRKGPPSDRQDWKAYFSDATAFWWIMIVMMGFLLIITITAISYKTHSPAP